MPLAVITLALLVAADVAGTVGLPGIPPRAGAPGLAGVTVSVDVSVGVSVNGVPPSAALTIDDTNWRTWLGLTWVTSAPPDVVKLFPVGMVANWMFPLVSPDICW